MRKLLTIVTPTYNQAEYLEKCIESVLPDVSSEIEYIIVNDGSSDNTNVVLQKYSKINNVNIVNQENIGQVKTLNKYWSKANSLYLTYLSSDDYVESGGIKKLLDYLVQNNSVDVVYPDFYIVNQNGDVIKTASNGDFSKTSLIDRMICQPGPLTIFKKELIERVGVWDPMLRVTPDYDFWVRASTNGCIRRFPEALAYYRVHEKSQSTGYMTIERAEEIASLSKKIRKALPRGSFNKFMQISSAYYIVGCNHYKSKRYWRATFWIMLSMVARAFAKVSKTY